MITENQKSRAVFTPKRAGFIAMVLCWGALASAAYPQQMSTTAKGAIGGGLLGAGTGAIVGAAVHHPVKGALIGAGVGAVGGGLIGHGLEQQEYANQRLQSQVNDNQRQIEYQRREIESLKQGDSASYGTNAMQAHEVE